VWSGAEKGFVWLPRPRAPPPAPALSISRLLRRHVDLGQILPTETAWASGPPGPATGSCPTFSLLVGRYR
jgi:hypothetical protein